MMRSEEASICAKFSALRSEWFDSILPSNTAAEMQRGCTTCEHFVNVARIYGRSRVSTVLNDKENDSSDERSDNLFSSKPTSEDDDSSVDIAKESEKTRGESNGKWT